MATVEMYETAKRMLKRYGSESKAMDVATDHAHGHAFGSEHYRYWLAVRNYIPAVAKMEKQVKP